LPSSLSFRWIILVVLTVCGLASGIVGLSIWRNRADDIDHALRHAVDTTSFMADQIDRIVQDIDEILIQYRRQAEVLDIATDDEFRQYFTAPRRYDLRGAMVASLGRVPDARHLVISDSRGDVVMSTNFGHDTPSIGDRPFFHILAGAKDDQLVVSGPFLGPLSGVPVLVFARRINGTEGAFRGTIHLSVTMEHFERAFRATGQSHGETMTLMHRTSREIVRIPDGPTPGAMPFDWHRAVAAGGGSFRIALKAGREPQWATVQPLARVPLVITLTVPEAHILANWRSQSIGTALGAAGFLGCLLALLGVIGRQIRRLSESRSELAGANRALAAALDNMSHGLCLFDADGVLRVCNERFRRIYGIADPIPLGTHRHAIEAMCRARLRHQPDSSEAGRPDDIDTDTADDPTDRICELADGRVVAVNCHRLAQGEWLEMHEDVTEQRRYQSRIEFLARRDPLTGTANRAEFLDRLQNVQRLARRRSGTVTVLMIDLDRFKDVNDTLGHPAGDALLRETTARITACISPHDTLARLGGDEFAVLCGAAPQAGDRPGDALRRAEEHAAKLATAIVAALREPYDIDGNAASISASVGIAIAAAPAETPTDLMKNADIALYEAKARGRDNFCMFVPDMKDAVEERLRLESDLHLAVQQGQFVLHYQPIVDVVTGQVSAVEALVRWSHPERGEMSPSEFIPIAEQTGLIVPLGDWILRQACLDAMRWPSDVSLSVNISTVQLRGANLLDTIMATLEETGLPPTRLEIEITENVLLEQSAGNISVLRQLKELGIAVVLDDFGTGYASLGYLTVFPFDKLKIDRTFIQELATRSDCMAVVGSAARLGRSLGMSVVAEGVEAIEHVEWLRSAGVVQVQGFCFSPPVPAAELRFGDMFETFESHAEPERTPKAGSEGGSKVASAA